LTLAPAQGGTLELKNPRATYGILGPERKDAKLLPGDVLFLAFDITGLQVKDNGQVQYSMGIELFDANGKSKFSKDPQDLEANNSLGGTSVPAVALAEIGTDTPKGKYRFKVTVKDRLAKTTKVLDYPFEVLERKLGFARVALHYDGGQPAPPIAVAGQTYLVTFAVVGFKLKPTVKNPKIEQPWIKVEMRVLDENGKPTLAKAFTGETKEVADQFKKIVPMDFALQLNRPGKFKIEIKATDEHAKEAIKQELSITVLKGS
jgi:hypothetical protein